MKFIKVVLTNIKDFFQNYFIALSIFFGFIFLGSSIFNNDDDNWDKLCYSIGSIMLTGGIFGGIAKSKQFTEIYQKILRDIIYGNEHLEKRNDLESIWENVTSVLSNRKFSKISSQMNKNIKKYFLPLEHDYYYDKFNIEIVIELLEDDYLLIKETVSFNIVCEDENLEIDSRFRCENKIDMSNKEKTSYKLKKLSINGENQDCLIDKKYEKNKLIAGYSKKLKGKKSYMIEREDEKVINLNYNPIKSQIAVWIYNNLKLDITYPEELEIEIRGLGLLNDLNRIDKDLKGIKRQVVDYKGLIYKNQGFFMIMKKKI